MAGVRAETAGHDMKEVATRHPLSWPTGWRRIGRIDRRRARFGQTNSTSMRRESLTLAAARSRLLLELGRLGVAVYFSLKGQMRCLACDAWDRVADNICAVAQHIDALRRIDRYGVGTMEQAFAGYGPRLQAAPSEWNIVLGVALTATIEQINEAFTRLSKTAHPDAGGSHDAMARLTEARAMALRSFE